MERAIFWDDQIHFKCGKTFGHLFWGRKTTSGIPKSMVVADAKATSNFQ